MHNVPNFFVIDSKEARKKACDYIANLRASPVMCVDIKEYPIKRSIAQNSMFHAWVSLLARSLGYTMNEMKREIKIQFLGFEKNKHKDGTEYLELRHTSDLKVDQFTELLEKVEAFAITQNVVLTQPDYYGLAMYGIDSRAC